ncbi:MAG: hypothetical protein HY907_01950 [Deltaproteobacteria bacterium]|nr:hypothetical protein [Deltaproteobacteria bacterium]
MPPIDTAAALLELEPKWLQPFDVVDPFHGTHLEGFLALKPDHRYGALALLQVDGAPVPQRIFATPKLHYPFDRQGTFHFPPVQRVRIYEKLDGTNVCAYRYRDAAGTPRTTYKLRLHPVLRNGTWGPFLDMWRRMLERHPGIADLPERNGCSLSFELYGAENPHLVLYDVPLACALLFGVDEHGGVIPPADLVAPGVPNAPLLADLDAGDDPVARYAALRTSLESGLGKLDDGKLSGAEGAVWYVTPRAGGTVLFKCKPESVEAIHWAGGINKAAVEATCWNLLETADVLDYEGLAPLLLEEYSQDELDRFRRHIDDTIRAVNVALAFRRRVLEEYERVGVPLEENKALVMRALSTRFPRDQMKKVHSIIASRPRR